MIAPDTTHTSYSQSLSPPSPLLTSANAQDHVHLIIGTGPLASSRCTKSLEVGAHPIIISGTSSPLSPEVTPSTANETRTDVHFNLAKKIEDGQAMYLNREVQIEQDLLGRGRLEVGGVVDAVFYTPVNTAHSDELATRISLFCRRNRIPINVTDRPDLCTFSLLSTHSDGPLHIGITTSGRGCKLASRLRREVAASLPQNLGAAIERLGAVRRRIWEEDQKSSNGAMDEASSPTPAAVDDEEDSAGQRHTFNTLVTPEDADYARYRRMRWLSQICEYWPLRRLAQITDADVDAILTAYVSPPSKAAGISTNESDRSSATLSNGKNALTSHRNGTIILAGSGPGNPELLTRATHRAIKTADLILADKLVPAPVLDLIPRRTEVHIARKFPGNADRAQEELLELGLAGLKQGRKVLRLKQGDPYLYGRGAEEFAFFREHNYTPIVLPGITSALSAPLFAAIPPTHRNVADRVLVCTGTGRKGAAPELPTFVTSQTVVFLMALHRLQALVGDLITVSPAAADTETGQASSSPQRTPYPPSTPCAVIERASCPDQRVIRTTLAHVCAAVEEAGSRPPGLFVVGAACEVLETPGGGKPWVIEEGFRGLDGLAGDEELGLKEILENDGLVGSVSKDVVNGTGLGNGHVGVPVVA